MSRSPSRGHLLVANALAGLDELGYRTGAFARRIDLPVVARPAAVVVVSMIARCASLSAMMPTASESLQIQSICGPDEVRDRDGDRSGRPDREIQQDPSVRVALSSATRSPGLMPLCDEALRDFGDPLRGGLRIEGCPPESAPVEDDGPFRMVGREVEEDIGAIAAVGDRERRRHGVFGWHGTGLSRVDSAVNLQR